MDLTTRYLGLDLKNPFVPSASPLSKTLDQARALEDHGAAAIVMWSLFEEAITADSEAMTRFLHHQDTGFAEAGAGFLPAQEDFPSVLEQYLDQLRRLKSALDIPVIASLNGVTPGGWIRHATELQAAGADALELNVYYVAADIAQTGAQVEERYLEILRELRAQIQIPITMKLSPGFSSPGNFVGQLAAAGANGVSLFNRFYQPDIDIDNLRLQPRLHLSTPAEALLAMRWIAILYGRFEGLSLAATGGIHTATEAIKLLIAGADVVQLCSALLLHGPAHLGTVIRDTIAWMEGMGCQSLGEVRGCVSALTAPDPAAFERANYLNVIDSYSPAPGVLM